MHVSCFFPSVLFSVIWIATMRFIAGLVLFATASNENGVYIYRYVSVVNCGYFVSVRIRKFGSILHWIRRTRISYNTNLRRHRHTLPVPASTHTTYTYMCSLKSAVVSDDWLTPYPYSNPNPSAIRVGTYIIRNSYIRSVSLLLFASLGSYLLDLQIADCGEYRIPIFMRIQYCRRRCYVKLHNFAHVPM